MKAFATAVFTGLNLGHLAAASGSLGSCEAEGSCNVESTALPTTGTVMMQKTVSKAAVETAGVLYEYEGSEGWPNCGGWSDAQIDEALAKERALFPQIEKNTQMCLDGYEKKIYWDMKKIAYIERCLKIRFGTYVSFAEDGVSEGSAEGGGALLEKSTELTDAEVAESKSQGWPDWNTLTEAEGIRIIKETEAQVKKDQKFRADVCPLGVYWAKKKMAYIESCRPDDDERKARR